jgi:hypothetical protein
MLGPPLEIEMQGRMPFASKFWKQGSHREVLLEPFLHPILTGAPMHRKDDTSK